MASIIPRRESLSTYSIYHPVKMRPSLWPWLGSLVLVGRNVLKLVVSSFLGVEGIREFPSLALCTHFERDGLRVRYTACIYSRMFHPWGLNLPLTSLFHRYDGPNSQFTDQATWVYLWLGALSQAPLSRWTVWDCLCPPKPGCQHHRSKPHQAILQQFADKSAKILPPLGFISS